MKPTKITASVAPNINHLRLKIQEVIEIVNLIIELLPEDEEVEVVEEVEEVKPKTRRKSKA